MTWIELMSQFESSRATTSREQVYLIERDAGLLCRILGLYAARSIDVLHVNYAYAAQEVMKLRVKIARETIETAETADHLRVLVAKVATLVGVIAAAQQVESGAYRHEEAEV